MTKTLFKTLAIALCVVGTGLALSACEATGDQSGEKAVPYSEGRTAGAGMAAEAPSSERTFRRAQSK